MGNLDSVFGPATFRDTEHRCHARGCKTSVPPRLLMCVRHWRMVPRSLQQEVWKHFVPGQEAWGKGGKIIPTREYLKAARAAIDAAARAERSSHVEDVSA